MPRIVISRSLLSQTAEALRKLSQAGNEAVALWVGDDLCDWMGARLVLPEQIATAMHFDVPLPARLRLIQELAASGSQLLVQFHTHPGEAFHSPADDRLALPRRTGGLSVVVPRFGRSWFGSLDDPEVLVFIHRGKLNWSPAGRLGDVFEFAS